MTTTYTDFLNLLYQSYDEPEEQLVEELINFYRSKGRFGLQTIIDGLDTELRIREREETSSEWKLNSTLFLVLLNKEFPQYEWEAHIGLDSKFKGTNKSALPNSEYIKVEAENIKELYEKVFETTDFTMYTLPIHSFITKNQSNIELISNNK
jgi:hypothetical protein